MGPPVLCVRQIRKTLSAKKSLKNVTKSRNVLAWPKNFELYRDNWPVLDKQTDDELKTLLENLLPPAVLPSRSLPLAVVKKVKGEERKERRRCLQASGATDLRRRLLPGLNCVLRAVAKGEAAAVLVAVGAPRRLAELVLCVCRRGKVPVVVMPTLDAATRGALGFGCLALGLRRVRVNQSQASMDQSQASIDSEHFASLKDRLAELAAAFPCQREVVSSDNAPFPAVEIVVKAEPVDEARLSSASVYKLRPSRLQRAFRPPRRSCGAEVKTEVNMGVKAEVKAQTKMGVKAEVKAQTKTEVQAEVKAEPKLALVDVEGQRKRNADFLQQDFIPFGDWPVASQSGSSIKPAEKPKAADPTPSNVAPATEKLKVPAYRPLVVKSIQPNPAKKKKGKTPKAAG